MTDPGDPQDLPATSEEQLDRISARFEIEHAQARRRTLWLTLVPIVVGLLVVAIASNRVSRLQNEVSTLEKSRAEVQTELATLERRLATREQQLLRVQTEIDDKTAELKEVVELLDQGKTARARQVAEKATRPRVYIQRSVQGQEKEKAREIADALRQEDFVVPKEELVEAEKVPRNSQVRFFREEDRENGASIERLLRDLGVEAKAVYVRGHEDSTALRPGHFEIWLSSPSGSG